MKAQCVVALLLLSLCSAVVEQDQYGFEGQDPEGERMVGMLERGAFVGRCFSFNGSLSNTEIPTDNNVALREQEGFEALDELLHLLNDNLLGEKPWQFEVGKRMFDLFRSVSFYYNGHDAGTAEIAKSLAKWSGALAHAMKGISPDLFITGDGLRQFAYDFEKNNLEIQIMERIVRKERKFNDFALQEAYIGGLFTVSGHSPLFLKFCTAGKGKSVGVGPEGEPTCEGLQTSLLHNGEESKAKPVKFYAQGTTGKLALSNMWNNIKALNEGDQLKRAFLGILAYFSQKNPSREMESFVVAPYALDAVPVEKEPL